MYIKFLHSNELYEGTVSTSENVATLKFKEKNVPVNTNGFDVFKDKECLYNLGGDFYKSFTTLYRNDSVTEQYNGYQLSNDGSVYTNPLKTVTFYSGVGGTIDGDTVQEVYRYEELTLPLPFPDENYKFSSWVPTIPTSGEIDRNKSYTATFTSLLPPPEPEPSDLILRVEVLEDDVKKINDALGGIE